MVYKAIFKQGEDTESMEVKSKGFYITGEKTRITLDINDKLVDISYHDRQITLRNGNSVLLLHLDKDVWNQYEVPYGHIQLKTRTCFFEVNDRSLKLKYELYDQSSLISSVYIMIQMKDIILPA